MHTHRLTYTRLHTDTHSRMHTYVHTHKDTQKAHTHTHTHTHLHTHTHTHTHTCTQYTHTQGLELAWSRQGRLPWQRLVRPAASLARTGFKAYPALVLVLSDPDILARIKVRRQQV